MESDIEFGALTDVGRQRQHNEDNFLVDRKLGLFVVCDGMGGHAAGEVASAVAIRTFHEEIKREQELINDYVAKKTGGARVSKRDLLNMLEFAINRASSKVHAESLKDQSKRGMGTTLVSILVVGSEAFIAYVGDSRLYMLRDGVLEQVTEDHTVYNELVRRKKLSREQIDNLSQKNAITRAVGVYEHVQPDTLILDLLAGDRFLLCSDGLSGYFENNPEALGQMMLGNDLSVSARLMIDAANEAGGGDNITAVIVAVGAGRARDENRAKQLQLKRDTLARMPLFRALNDREILRVLQVTEVLAYAPGQRIITQGETGDELFIVLTGQARVIRGEAEIARLNPGDHFGEMALVRSQPRSATVESADGCELMAIRRGDFFEILRHEHQLAVKLLWQFLGVLSDRLADTSRELGAAREGLMAEDITHEIFEDDEDDDHRRTLVAPPPDSTPAPPVTDNE